MRVSESPELPVTDDGDPAPRLLRASVQDANGTMHVTVVKMDGRIRFLRYTSHAIQGGGGVTLAGENLERLRALLKKLPPSSSRVLTDQRKLVLQRFEDDSVQASTYDYANAPESVLEILRITGIGEPVWTVRIPEDGQWQAHRHDEGGLVYLPKRDLLVSCARYQPLKVWEGASRRLVREIEWPNPHSESAEQMSASPDERYIALTGSGCMILDTATWRIHGTNEGLFRNANHSGCRNPTFTPDGTFLFLQTLAKETGFYRTGTWESASRPPGFPHGMVKFSRLGTSDRFVTLDGTGKLAITDSKGRSIPLRESGVGDFCCSDMPSVGQVAVAIGMKNPFQRLDYRIFIFDAESGNLERELLPFEQFYRDARVMDLFSVSNSDYIMAVLEGGEISIWNVKTGRHRGTLRSVHQPNQTVFNENGNMLYSFGRDGIIRYWEMGTALAKVRAFEEGLD